MNISFNIPTYNRAKYLAISLDKITKQIEEMHVQDKVEINLSDNASTDNTKEVWDNCVKAHPTITFTYKRNDQNLGPDKNFLSAMRMARGEYSLLWGDDDYLKDGGLKRIFELIEYGEKNDVQILISSTSVVDKNGKLLKEKYFLRKDVEELLVDFSDINQARAYFFLLKDMGGLLSFISDVIYKTTIINELPYMEEFTGTHYAFLNYWWGWLAKGKKLYYNRESFVDETVQYQKAYGYGVKRCLVDYDGYLLIANKLLRDVSWYNDFKQAVVHAHSLIKYRTIYFPERTDFKKYLGPKIEECSDDSILDEFYVSCSTKMVAKSLILCLMPEKLIKLMKSLQMKLRSWR